MLGLKQKKKKYSAYNDQRERPQCTSLCHAPFRNLLFVQSGGMMVCHYNRAFTAGVYPQDSIRDAWNGLKINSLRNSLQAYDFPSGCAYCEQEVSAGNILSAGCKKYDYLAGPDTGHPVSMEFQTSNICNLQCVMCSGEYSSAIRRERERGAPYANPYDERFFDEVRPYLALLSYASFTGGEPFLNELYYRIWEEVTAVNPGLNISVSTNGTILNETIKEFLRKLDMRLTISIDSIQPQTYERIRYPASYTQTMDNMAFFTEFMKEKKRLLSVKFVVMSENIREVPELFEYFHSQEIQLYPKPVWVPYEQSLRLAEPEVLEDHIALLRSHRFNGGGQVRDFNIFRYNELIHTLEGWLNERKTFSPDSLSKSETTELEIKLYTMVRKAIEQDEMISEPERNALIISSRYSLDALLKSGIEEAKRRNLLIELLSLPPYIIINDLYRKNTDKFVARFQYKQP